MKVDILWAEMRRQKKSPGKSKSYPFHEVTAGFLPEKVSGLYLPKWLFLADDPPERCHLLIFPSRLLRDHESQRATLRTIIQQIKSPE